MNALNQSLKALGSLMSRLTSVWLTMSMKTNQKKGWSGFHRIERILWEQNTTEGTENMQSNW